MLLDDENIQNGIFTSVCELNSWTNNGKMALCHLCNCSAHDFVIFKKTLLNLSMADNAIGADGFEKLVNLENDLEVTTDLSLVKEQDIIYLSILLGQIMYEYKTKLIQQHVYNTRGQMI